MQPGDHGGTYAGNPLACAVAHAVLRHLLDNDVAAHVAELGDYALAEMAGWQRAYPAVVTDVRGRGLLLLVELRDEPTAARVAAECLARKVFVRQTQDTGIRVFPALTIERQGVASAEGLATLRQAIELVARSGELETLRLKTAIGPAAAPHGSSIGTTAYITEWY